MWRKFLYNVTPPVLINLARIFNNSSCQGRDKDREIARLRQYPRFTPVITDLLGKKLEIVDSLSFISMYIDIFQKQIYRFETEDINPYIIDGGANVGLSVIYFKQLYPHSKIIAFEADADIFKILQRNIEFWQCDDIELVCKALWQRETELMFVSNGADAGRVARGNELCDKIIPTTRLRDYLTHPVSFLKLDIEGAETEVIKDCADLLVNVDNLFVEYHSFKREPQTLHLLAALLIDAGFRLYIENSCVVSGQPFINRSEYLGMDLQLNIFAYRCR